MFLAAGDLCRRCSLPRLGVQSNSKKCKRERLDGGSKVPLTFSSVTLTQLLALELTLQHASLRNRKERVKQEARPPWCLQAKIWEGWSILLEDLMVISQSETLSSCIVPLLPLHRLHLPLPSPACSVFCLQHHHLASQVLWSLTAHKRVFLRISLDWCSFTITHQGLVSCAFRSTWTSFLWHFRSAQPTSWSSAVC